MALIKKMSATQAQRHRTHLPDSTDDPRGPHFALHAQGLGSERAYDMISSELCSTAARA